VFFEGEEGILWFRRRLLQSAACLCSDMRAHARHGTVELHRTSGRAPCGCEPSSLVRTGAAPAACVCTGGGVGDGGVDEAQRVLQTGPSVRRGSSSSSSSSSDAAAAVLAQPETLCPAPWTNRLRATCQTYHCFWRVFRRTHEQL